MTTTHPIEEGARVRMSRRLTDDEMTWALPPRYGDEFTVDDFLTAGDPDQGEIDVDFYDGTDSTGSSVIVPADAVELVMSAVKMRARKPPTARQILDAISTGLLDDFIGFRTDETEPDGEGRAVYGRTDDGLTFGFTIHVTAIWETDL